MKDEYSFKKPPINELICGIRLPLGLIDLKVIWNIYSKIKDKYPIIEEKLPFDEDIFNRQHNPNFNISSALVRYWFISEDRNQLIQIQDGALYCNWRKENKSETYPKFESIFSDFKSILEILKSMVTRLEFTGAELSYINNIDINEYNLSSGRLDALINQVIFSNFFENTNAFNYRLNVPLEVIDGLYFVDIKTAIMKSVDGKTKPKDVILWNNGVKSNSFKEPLNIDFWFNTARNIINEQFINITTQEFKNYLGYVK